MKVKNNKPSQTSALAGQSIDLIAASVRGGGGGGGGEWARLGFAFQPLWSPRFVPEKLLLYPAHCWRQLHLGAWHQCAPICLRCLSWGRRGDPLPTRTLPGTDSARQLVACRRSRLVSLRFSVWRQPTTRGREEGTALQEPAALARSGNAGKPEWSNSAKSGG